MGGSSAGGNGGGGGSPNQMAKDKARKDAAAAKAVRDKETRQAKIRAEQKAKQKKKTNFKNVTKENLNPNNNVQTKITKPKNIIEKIVDKSPVINLLKNNPISKKTEEVNRKFYEEKVVPAGKSTAPNYETYMKDRLSGKTDAYGNKTARDNDGGNNNKPTPKVKLAEIPKVKTAPTEAEVSQSAATDTTTVEEPKKVDDIYTRKRKAKARGRSMMTLTGPRGLKKDEKLTLGRPSLLGS